MSTTGSVTTSQEPAPTLVGTATPVLGLRGTFSLWTSLGISLLLPVAASFVVLAGRPLGVTLGAVAVGSVIGAVILGLTAAPGARERVPAMVLLRGLLGRHGSSLPTGLNIIQCLGWATFEIVVIAEAASRALDLPRWPFVLAAGAVATVMALRPLGMVRLLTRFGIWAALAAVAYLFVGVLREPLPQVQEGGAQSFWSAVDIVIALPVSWFPLAADYTRHVRTPRTAFLGTAGGYGIATLAMFSLGVLALSAYGAVGLDVVDALLAAPFGLLAVLVLVTVEVDEAFANIYSGAVSTQNLSARLDRRVLAVVVGTVATLLALSLDVVSYEPFLFLLGAVFVPLAGVFLVAYYAMPAGSWDVSEQAPARPALLLPWVAGFVSYQLTVPTYFFATGAGWTTWWTARQADLGISPTHGLSASLVSLTVASLLTTALVLPQALRAHRAARAGAATAAS